MRIKHSPIASGRILLEFGFENAISSDPLRYGSSLVSMVPLEMCSKIFAIANAQLRSRAIIDRSWNDIPDKPGAAPVLAFFMIFRICATVTSGLGSKKKYGLSTGRLGICVIGGPGCICCRLWITSKVGLSLVLSLHKVLTALPRCLFLANWTACLILASLAKFRSGAAGIVVALFGCAMVSIGLFELMIVGV